MSSLQRLGERMPLAISTRAAASMGERTTPRGRSRLPPAATITAASREGSRLVLENREGADLFADVEVNGRHPMEEFSPAEARRFAEAVNRAIREHRAVASMPRH